MRIEFPALNLKAKLIALIVTLLAMTLGAEMLVSLKAEEVDRQDHAEKGQRPCERDSDQRAGTDLDGGDRSRPAAELRERLHTRGLEVSIASNQDLIINSSNPKLIGAALNPEIVRALMATRSGNPRRARGSSGFDAGLADTQSTVYFIPVRSREPSAGLRAGGGELQRFRSAAARLPVAAVVAGRGDFRVGLVFAYVLAERYVEPIHAVG